MSIGRRSMYSHTLLIDEKHLSTANTRGDNLHLDLDGILFLGGVRDTMYEKLPSQILATSGFQGCLASIDLNGEAADPLRNALVPSPLVTEGCDGEQRFGQNRNNLFERGSKE